MQFSPSLLATAVSLTLLSWSAGASKPTTTVPTSHDKQSQAQLAAVEVRASVLQVSASTLATQQQLSSQQLELQQASNLTDLLRDVPGVTVTDIGRFGSAGINIRGLEGDQIGMSIDGMALGDSLDPASYANYDFFRVGRGGLDPAALKQVNVLKGADAISTGSGSLGGAVQFITKDPADVLPQDGRASYARLKVE